MTATASRMPIHRPIFDRPRLGFPATICTAQPCVGKPPRGNTRLHGRHAWLPRQSGRGGRVALPDFLVIGVPKAGTTALYAALTRHPQLYLPRVKEPKFFLCDGPPSLRRGGPGDIQTRLTQVWQRCEYEALFDPAPTGALRGEATPFYLYDRAAQVRIRRLVPQVRMIALLRDPVDRAHSNWVHLWSAGLEP